MCGRSAAGMPSPLSVTVIRAWPFSRTTPTDTNPPEGVWRSALSIRMSNSWRTRVGSASTRTPPLSSGRKSTPRSCARGSAWVIRSRTIAFSSSGCRSIGSCLASASASVVRSPTIRFSCSTSSMMLRAYALLGPRARLRSRERGVEGGILEEVLQRRAGHHDLVAAQLKHLHEGIGVARVEDELGCVDRVASDGQDMVRFDDGLLEVVVNPGLERLGDREVDDEVEATQDQDEQDEVLGGEARERAPEHHPDSR